LSILQSAADDLAAAIAVASFRLSRKATPYSQFARLLSRRSTWGGSPQAMVHKLPVHFDEF
jgi:hypothetical protein